MAASLMAVPALTTGLSSSPFQRVLLVGHEDWRIGSVEHAGPQPAEEYPYLAESLRSRNRTPGRGVERL